MPLSAGTAELKLDDLDDRSRLLLIRSLSVMLLPGRQSRFHFGAPPATVQQHYDWWPEDLPFRPPEQMPLRDQQIMLLAGLKKLGAELQPVLDSIDGYLAADDGTSGRPRIEAEERARVAAVIRTHHAQLFAGQRPAAGAPACLLMTLFAA